MDWDGEPNGTAMRDREGGGTIGESKAVWGGGGGGRGGGRMKRATTETRNSTMGDAVTGMGEGGQEARPNGEIRPP